MPVDRFEDSRPPGFPAPGEMTFWLTDPQLGRLDLSCQNGYVVKSYDLGYPNVRPVVYDIALDNGTYDLTRFHGARVVSLDVALRPTKSVSGRGELIMSEPRLRDRLLAYLQPGRRPNLIFQEYEDDRVRMMQLRAENAALAVSLPRFNSLSVSWVVPRGVIWSATDNCYVWRFDSAAQPEIVKVHNDGNTPAHWTATIRGAIYYPTFEFVSTGAKLRLEYTSSPGDVIDIDSFTRRVTINGEPVGYRYVSEDKSTWWLIPPGEHEIRFTHNDVIVAGDLPGLWNYTEGSVPPEGTPGADEFNYAHWQDPAAPVIGLTRSVWATGVEVGGGVPGADGGEIRFCLHDAWL